MNIHIHIHSQRLVLVNLVNVVNDVVCLVRVRWIREPRFQILKKIVVCTTSRSIAMEEPPDPAAAEEPAAEPPAAEVPVAVDFA